MLAAATRENPDAPERRVRLRVEENVLASFAFTVMATVRATPVEVNRMNANGQWRGYFLEVSGEAGETEDARWKLIL